METPLLIVTILFAWYWFDSMQKHDIAVRAGQQAAERYQLQFLDDTVAFSAIRLKRDAHGRVRLLRTYRFEVSDTGHERLPCSITLLGEQIAHLDMPPYRDNVIWMPGSGAVH